MKHVYSDMATIAHLWANQLQDEARNHGNFFFEGDTIYSYGYHFAIAKHVANSEGVSACLFTIRGYSNTTAKHISIVRYASSHLNKLYCAYPTDSHEANFSYWLKEAEPIAEKLLRARKPEIYLSELGRLEAQAKRYADFFGIELPIDLQAVLAVSSKESFLGYREAKEALELAEKQRQAKLAKIQEKKERQEFFAYERNYIYSRTGIDYIRISLDGSMVETSQRVRVPLKEAKILYLMIKQGKDIKGYKIDGWTVIGLNGTLKVGCHSINRANMVLVGEKLLEL